MRCIGTNIYIIHLQNHHVGIEFIIISAYGIGCRCTNYRGRVYQVTLLKCPEVFSYFHETVNVTTVIIKLSLENGK